MFEKKEDKLFEYAFGDLDAHDAQVFEASLLKDDASAEELKFLQSIKGDLMSFRDIPEMQYSKERLRDAILGQGLKPSRPSLPWLNWVLAPGALACTFALGYVLMNGTSHKEPVLVGSNLGANSSKGVGLVLPKSILNSMLSVESADHLSDLVSYTLLDNFHDKQLMLETLDVGVRLQKLVGLLQRQIQQFELWKTLQGKLPNENVGHN